MADVSNTTGTETERLLAALKALSDATDMADEFEHQSEHRTPDEACPLCIARQLIAELEG